jgi:hypothetical protein
MMKPETRKRFVKRCAKVEWRKAFLPFYHSCPHEYLYRKRNRTDRRALNNGGYPSKPDLARIRKRFWPTKTDRLRYKELYG